MKPEEQKSAFWEEFDERRKKTIEEVNKKSNKDIKICCLLFFGCPIILILACLFPYITIPILFIVLLKVYKKHKT